MTIVYAKAKVNQTYTNRSSLQQKKKTTTYLYPADGGAANEVVVLVGPAIANIQYVRSHVRYKQLAVLINHVKKKDAHELDTHLGS